MEDPPSPVLIPDDDSFGGGLLVTDDVGPATRGEPSNNDLVEGDSANEIAHIFVCPPSCTKMEEMLRRIPHISEVDMPPSKMFEFITGVFIYLFFIAAGERYSWHGSMARTLFGFVDDCCSYEGLHLPSYGRRGRVALEAAAV